MTEQTDPRKIEIAKQSAKLFLHQMVAVQADVQLMAIELLAKLIFKTGIKESKRLQLFDRWSRAIRKDIQDDMRRKPDGEEAARHR